MFISLPNGHSIQDLESDDCHALVKHLSDGEIQRSPGGLIPFPYTHDDADFWIDYVKKDTEKNKQSTIWCIRNPQKELIGSIGFHDLTIGKSYRAEIGYWVAPPYWGQSIMTHAVGEICKYAFDRFNLQRISANIVAENSASIRVVEKNGFQFEGRLKNFFKKDKQPYDGLLYAKIRIPK